MLLPEREGSHSCCSSMDSLSSGRSKSNKGEGGAVPVIVLARPHSNRAAHQQAGGLEMTIALSLRVELVCKLAECEKAFTASL